MYEAPAVQFYFGDFLNDTADMTLEERGAYITLLGYAWINVGIPKDEKKIRRILGISPHKFSKIWPELLPKFFEMPDGFMNPRMEEERAKQIAYRAKQAENGRKGGRPKTESDGFSDGSGLGLPNTNPEESSSSTTSLSSYEGQSTAIEPSSSPQSLKAVETQSPDFAGMTEAEKQRHIREEIDRATA